jgi:hypothetical protein
MSRLTDLQAERNQSTKDSWVAAEMHRQIVSGLLAGTSQEASGKLCVLGAGNCNDLDLQQLLKAFSEVHLVDIDTQAVEHGLQRQEIPQNNSRIKLHGGIDLTGVWGKSERFTPQQPPSEQEAKELLQAIRDFEGPQLPAPFDCTASVCLLSQLIEGILLSVGEDHESFIELVQEVRRAHINVLLKLTKPGGTGFLITDFVSSDTVPELRTIPQEGFAEKLAEIIRAGNFFHGLNPFLLGELFKNDSEISPKVQRFRLLKPWPWDFGNRVYAVTGIQFVRG